MTESKKYPADIESLKSGISEELDNSTLQLVDHQLPQNSGAALSFLQPLLKYGQISTALSYGLYSSVNGNKVQYFTRRPRVWGIITGLLFGLMCLHLACIVVNFDFSVSQSKLVNMIKRVTHGIFVVELLTLYCCLQNRGRTQGLWVKILNQSDLIQKQFANLKIPIPSVNKARIAVIGVCSFFAFLTIVHVIVFCFVKSDDDWEKYFTKKIFNTVTLGFWSDAFLDDIPFEISVICGIFGLILVTFCWNLWYFVDSFRFVTALLAWTVFRSLNKAVSTKKLGIDRLSDVMDLHCSGTKLLNLLNQLMGPLTFISTVLNILHACFWTNYCLINIEFKFSYILGLITVLRMVIVFYFVADVNSQAYQITTWIENHFMELDKIPETINKTKLAVFTSLIYSRESIGFKGMYFFTCTQVLNIAIAGLVLTYTVVVNQVATH